jgi:hypothetical protein
MIKIRCFEKAEIVRKSKFSLLLSHSEHCFDLHFTLIISALSTQARDSLHYSHFENEETEKLIYLKLVSKQEDQTQT